MLYGLTGYYLFVKIYKGQKSRCEMFTNEVFLTTSAVFLLIGLLGNISLRFTSAENIFWIFLLINYLLALTYYILYYKNKNNSSNKK